MPDGSTLHPLPSMNVTPDVGLTRVVATLVSDGVPNLWVFRLAKGSLGPGATQLTAEPGSGSFPHWSPDGRSIAYQCGEGVDTHVCVVGADGAGRRQLTHERGQSFIGSWMGNDGVLVAVRREAVWNVVSVDVGSGVVAPLTAFTDARSFVRYPRWDPAGRRILFERAETTGNIWSVQVP